MDGNRGKYVQFTLNGKTIFRAKFILNALMYAGDAKVTEKGRFVFFIVFQQMLYGILRHADSIVRDVNLYLICGGRIQADLYDSGGSGGFDAMEDGVFHNGLKRKAENLTIQKRFVVNLIVQCDGAAVAVFLNCEIIVQQREFGPNRDGNLSALGDAF